MKISVFSVKITWSCQSENTAKTNLIARDANAMRIVFENHKIGINKRSFKKIFFSALLMPCLLKVFYSSTPNPSSISPSRSPSSPVVLSVWKLTFLLKIFRVVCGFSPPFSKHHFKIRWAEHSRDEKNDPSRRLNECIELIKQLPRAIRWFSRWAPGRWVNTQTSLLHTYECKYRLINRHLIFS